jgi:hypothetical protein
VVFQQVGHALSRDGKVELHTLSAADMYIHRDLPPLVIHNLTKYVAVQGCVLTSDSSSVDSLTVAARTIPPSSAMTLVKPSSRGAHASCVPAGTRHPHLDETFCWSLALTAAQC